MQVDDVSGADSSEQLTAPGAVANCDPLPTAENRAAITGDGVTTSFDLGGGVTATSVVSTMDSTALLDDIDAAIEECVSLDDPAQAVVERLADLPAGVIGYQAVSARSSGDQHGTRLWTYADDRLVGVGLTRPASSPNPDIDLADLLDTAVERSTDFDTDE